MSESKAGRTRGLMDDKALLDALRKVGPNDRHCCLGCGYEHSCSIHGCAVLNAAADRIRTLLSEAVALRAQQAHDNAPLTLEELWEMDGEPVWNDTMKKWYFVVLSWEHGPVAMDYKGAWRPLDDRYYRRKPEEVEG